MRTSARCRHAQSGGHEAACTPHTSAGGHHARSGRQPSRPTLLQGVPSRQNRPTRKRPSNYPARPTPLTFPHTFPTQSQAGVRVLRPVRKDRGDRRTPRCRSRHLRSTLEYSACHSLRPILPAMLPACKSSAKILQCCQWASAYILFISKFLSITATSCPRGLKRLTEGQWGLFHLAILGD